jgi:DNA-directed RNA polymerase specialized sigma24 family protein
MSHKESNVDSAASGDLYVIARCINRDEDAWKSLFHRYQPRLLAIIKGYLGPRAEVADLDAEEIAASIWYSLVVKDSARLRRYDPARGVKLLTYLSALARREIWKRYRRAQCRQSRESRVARVDAIPGDDGRCGLLLQEFLETLTPRERQFCLTYLMAIEQGEEPPLVSPCNAWQLRSRVMRKLRHFSSGPSTTDRNAV